MAYGFIVLLIVFVFCGLLTFKTRCNGEIYRNMRNIRQMNFFVVGCHLGTATKKKRASPTQSSLKMLFSRGISLLPRPSVRRLYALPSAYSLEWATRPLEPLRKKDYGFHKQASNRISRSKSASSLLAYCDKKMGAIEPYVLGHGFLY